MPLTITGSAAAFDVTATYTKTAPADGDPLNAASVEDNTTTPKTDMQADANAIEYFRVHATLHDRTETITSPWTHQNSIVLADGTGTKGIINGTSTATTWVLFSVKTNGAGDQVREFHGNGTWCRTVNAQWNDSTAKWSSNVNGNASTMVYLDESGHSFRYKAPTAATWNDGTGAGAWTSQALLDLILGVFSTTGSITAGTFLKATTYVEATTKLVADTARSSATPGAGQSMGAGETWADTSAFAYCRLKHTGANTNTVTRSLNLASAPTEAVTGKYVFALQTAAPNGLIVIATVAHAGGSYFASVQPSTVTASAFQVWVYDLTPALVDLSVNDELHIVVYGY